MAKRVFILLGATGDLSKKKLFPAFYKLYKDQKLEDTVILGGAHTSESDEEFRDILKKNLKEYSDVKKPEQKFINKIFYNSIDLNDIEGYRYLFERADKLGDKNYEMVIYLAIPPEFFETTLSHFDTCEIDKFSGRNIKIVFEKPFGTDLKSAQALNKRLMEVFDEEQIYRIDHYLGKDTVQNFMAVRFANHFLEPLWNSRHVENVQITGFEEIGIDNRGGYYDSAGALKDMVQNHLFQMLAYIAMEPPAELDHELIRDEKVKVFYSLEDLEGKSEDVIFGQYDGYTKEPHVNPSSKTETFFAAKVKINNWRWDGVPFYIRTGKKMKKKGTAVVVVFKDVPNILYNKQCDVERNKLVIRVQPDSSIKLMFNVMSNHSRHDVNPITAEFDHKKYAGLNTPEAYEVLLLEIFKGDSTLFTRWDGVQESWKRIDKLLTHKKDSDTVHIYKQGSFGPDEANHLIEKDGRKWYNDF